MMEFSGCQVDWSPVDAFTSHLNQLNRNLVQEQETCSCLEELVRREESEGLELKADLRRLRNSIQGRTQRRPHLSMTQANLRSSLEVMRERLLDGEYENHLLEQEAEALKARLDRVQGLHQNRLHQVKERYGARVVERGPPGGEDLAGPQEASPKQEWRKLQQEVVHLARGLTLLQEQRRLYDAISQLQQMSVRSSREDAAGDNPQQEQQMDVQMSKEEAAGDIPEQEQSCMADKVLTSISSDPLPMTSQASGFGKRCIWQCPSLVVADIGHKTKQDTQQCLPQVLTNSLQQGTLRDLIPFTADWQRQKMQHCTIPVTADCQRQETQQCPIPATANLQKQGTKEHLSPATAGQKMLTIPPGKQLFSSSLSLLKLQFPKHGERKRPCRWASETRNNNSSGGVQVTPTCRPPPVSVEQSQSAPTSFNSLNRPASGLKSNINGSQDLETRNNYDVALTTCHTYDIKRMGGSESKSQGVGAAEILPVSTSCTPPPSHLQGSALTTPEMGVEVEAEVKLGRSASKRPRRCLGSILVPSPEIIYQRAPSPLRLSYMMETHQQKTATSAADTNPPHQQPITSYGSSRGLSFNQGLEPVLSYGPPATTSSLSHGQSAVASPSAHDPPITVSSSALSTPVTASSSDHGLPATASPSVHSPSAKGSLLAHGQLAVAWSSAHSPPVIALTSTHKEPVTAWSLAHGPPAVASPLALGQPAVTLHSTHSQPAKASTSAHGHLAIASPLIHGQPAVSLPSTRSQPAVASTSTHSQPAKAWSSDYSHQPDSALVEENVLCSSQGFSLVEGLVNHDTCTSQSVVSEVSPSVKSEETVVSCPDPPVSRETRLSSYFTAKLNCPVTALSVSREAGPSPYFPATPSSTSSSHKGLSEVKLVQEDQAGEPKFFSGTSSHKPGQSTSTSCDPVYKLGPVLPSTSWGVGVSLPQHDSCTFTMAHSPNNTSMKDGALSLFLSPPTRRPLDEPGEVSFSLFGEPSSPQEAAADGGSFFNLGFASNNNDADTPSFFSSLFGSPPESQSSSHEGPAFKLF